jgi:uncharacterized iron-regulated membrane protein
MTRNVLPEPSHRPRVVPPPPPGSKVGAIWLYHPEKSALRHAIFQLHFWVGAIAAAYVFLISVTGTGIVFRNELSRLGMSMEPIVDLHANLWAGPYGRIVNGIGASCLTLLCATGAIIWWPGLGHWRRGLNVKWHTHFARVQWDLHSAVGFWTFPFVMLWGVSGIYLSLPNQFSSALGVDPGGALTGWLADLHFGRFGWLTKALWATFGLMPALLAFTGVFICCRRLMFKKPSGPRNFVP